jgi:hypothetical protein
LFGPGWPKSPRTRPTHRAGGQLAEGLGGFAEGQLGPNLSYTEILKSFAEGNLLKKVNEIKKLKTWNLRPSYAKKAKLKISSLIIK